MPGGGNNNSGWETHKENIQPLSRGRKVSILQHSLDTSRNVVDYEQEMEQQIRLYLHIESLWGITTREGLVHDHMLSVLNTKYVNFVPF